MPFFSVYCENNAKLIGKTVIITDCASGLGREIVQDFYIRGARIIMLNRNIDQTIDTMNEIKQKCIQLTDIGELVFNQCDFTSLASVKECARIILRNESHITILIINSEDMCLNDGLDHFRMFLGHFYLTMLLMPRIRSSVPARIVSISSDLYSDCDIDFEGIICEKVNNPLKSYSRYNLANLLFTRELAQKLKEHDIEGINTYCAYPGLTMAEVLWHLSNTFWGVKSIIRFLVPLLLTSPLQAAQTAIYCSVDAECADESGFYYRDCRKSSNPSKIADDKELSKKLWNHSMDYLKLKNYIPFTEPDRGNRTFENFFSL